MIRESSGKDFSRIYSMMLSAQSEEECCLITDEISPDEDEELEKYLAYIHTVYAVFGFGLWTVERKEDCEIIGRCGLQPIADEDSPLGRIELGYLIDVPFREKGYAYEACRAILDFAFNQLELEEVYAGIDERNIPSLRLAQKLGFQPAEPEVENDCRQTGHEMKQGSLWTAKRPDLM